MIRLFLWLAAITISMILCAGFGVYWLSKSGMAQAQQDSAKANAKAAALSISAQIDVLNRMLDKLVQDPDVLTAVTIGNASMLNTVATRLEKSIPGIMKVRLLLPGVTNLDEKNVPRMGYADIDLVNETFTHNQLPAIQGDRGADRHLAIARQITQNGQVIGVILASLKEDLVYKSFQIGASDDTYLELKQGTLVLATSGKPQSDNEIGQFRVLNTAWEIHYRYIGGLGFSDLILVICIIFLPAMVALLSLFVIQRKLSEILTMDLQSVTRAFKDMMTHSLKGNYPVQLTEMNAMISTLMQFKRVLDGTDKDTKGIAKDDFDLNIIVSDDDFDIDSLFDDDPNLKL